MKHNNRIFSILMALACVAFLASCQQSSSPSKAPGITMPLDMSNWGGDGSAGAADLVTLTGVPTSTVTSGNFTLTGATYSDQAGTTLIASGEGKTEIEVAVDGSGNWTSTSSAANWVSLTGGSINNGGGPVTLTLTADNVPNGTYGFRTHFINSKGRNGGDYKENKTGGQDVTVNTTATCNDVVTGPVTVYNVNFYNGLGTGSWTSYGIFGWSDNTSTATWSDNAQWNEGSDKSYNIGFNLEQWSYYNHTCPSPYWIGTDNGGYTGSLWVSIDGGTTWHQPIAWGTNGNNYYQINGNLFGNKLAVKTYTVDYSTDGSTVAGTFKMSINN